MKNLPADDDFCEIPELEETEFEFSVSACPRIEDANDFGDTCHSISFSMDVVGDAFQSFDD